MRKWFPSPGQSLAGGYLRPSAPKGRVGDVASGRGSRHGVSTLHAVAEGCRGPAPWSAASSERPPVAAVPAAAGRAGPQA